MVLKLIQHIVYSIAYKVLSPNQKIDLAKFIISDKTNSLLKEEISTEPFYSFLRNSDAFSKAFCKNYIENRSKFKSQIGQDCFVDTYYKGKQNGFFIEIGVGNGKDLSNTYFLEKERNWKGILVEPCQAFYSSIQMERNALLINKAIANKSSEKVTFIEHTKSGYLSSLESEHKGSLKGTKSYVVETINFNDLRLQNESSEIDYLSIDIEGNELNIVKSIDFNKHQIGVVSIEHNKNERLMKELIEYMTGFGYKYYDSSYFDWEIIFYK